MFLSDARLDARLTDSRHLSRPPAHASVADFHLPTAPRTSKNYQETLARWLSRRDPAFLLRCPTRETSLFQVFRTGDIQANLAIETLLATLAEQRDHIRLLLAWGSYVKGLETPVTFNRLKADRSSAPLITAGPSDVDALVVTTKQLSLPCLHASYTVLDRSLCARATITQDIFRDVFQVPDHDLENWLLARQPQHLDLIIMSYFRNGLVFLSDDWIHATFLRFAHGRDYFSGASNYFSARQTHFRALLNATNDFTNIRQPCKSRQKEYGPFVPRRCPNSVPTSIDAAYRAGQYQALSEILHSQSPTTRTQLVVTLLQIHGLSVSDRRARLDILPRSSAARQGTERYRELRVLISGKSHRFVAQEHGHCSFRFAEGNLFIGNHPLGVTAHIIESDSNDRTEGFYFPRYGESDPFSSVRFNPRNLGRCMGGCIFCQRAYSLPTKRESQSRRAWSAAALVDHLECFCGPSTFSKLSDAHVVTELYPDAREYIHVCGTLKTTLRKRGFRGTFRAIAQANFQLRDLRDFGEVVENNDFTVTLECFSERNSLMAPPKAVSIERLVDLLRMARDEGFAILNANYMAGIDSLQDAVEGLLRLKREAGLDTLGLNVFVPYTEAQRRLRHSEGWSLAYYWKLAEELADLGIGVFRSRDYERCLGLAALYETVDTDLAHGLGALRSCLR